MVERRFQRVCKAVTPTWLKRNAGKNGAVRGQVTRIVTRIVTALGGKICNRVSLDVKHCSNWTYEWAMRDSNPRLPACKAVLTN